VRVMDVFMALTDYREVDEGPALDERFDFMDQLFQDLVSHAYKSPENATLEDFAAQWAVVLTQEGASCKPPSRKLRKIAGSDSEREVQP